MAKPWFRVTVEKLERMSTTVLVQAKNAEDAQRKVDKQISSGKFKPGDQNWDTALLVEKSIKTTGDVDSAGG